MAAAWTEDRWMITVTKDDGGMSQVRSARYGTGRRWRVRYETPDGAERSRSFDRKPMAERFRIETSAALLAGTYRDPDAGKITLGKYAQGWMEGQTSDDVSRESADFRVRHIVAGLGGRRLDQLAASPSAVQAWIRGLRLAPYTARQCFSMLSSICNAAVEDGLMARNPCRARSIRLPQVDQRKAVPLEAPRVAALRAALPPRYRAMADAGTMLGLRQGEILGLSPDDFDFLRRTVDVRRQVKIVGNRLTFALPKRMKTRQVPLPDAAALAFAAHIAEFGTPEVTLPWHEPDTRRHGKPEKVRLMFISPRSRSAIRRHRFNDVFWKGALREASIPVTRENGMHVLRHTYASVLLAGGADVKRVAACLGHEDAGFTLRVYGHLMQGGEERVRKILDAAAAVPSPAREGSGS